MTKVYRSLALVLRAYCPTGPGGGVDNSCSSREASLGKTTVSGVARDVSEKLEKSWGRDGWAKEHAVGQIDASHRIALAVDNVHSDEFLAQSALDELKVAEQQVGLTKPMMESFGMHNGDEWNGLSDEQKNERSKKFAEALAEYRKNTTGFVQNFVVSPDAADADRPDLDLVKLSVPGATRAQEAVVSTSALEVTQFVKSLCSTDVLKELSDRPFTLAVKNESFRAFYDKESSEISIPLSAFAQDDDPGSAGSISDPSGGMTTFAHELGHHLELMIPGANEMCADFVLRRGVRAAEARGKDDRETYSKSQADEDLSFSFTKESVALSQGDARARVQDFAGEDILGFGYTKKERIIPGSFRHPYVGKLYADELKGEYEHSAGYPPTVNGKKTARSVDMDLGTEVLSMGIQFLREDARAFAREDPEHFALTLAILRGKTMKWKRRTASPIRAKRDKRRAKEQANAGARSGSVRREGVVRRHEVGNRRRQPDEVDELPAARHAASGTAGTESGLRSRKGFIDAVWRGREGHEVEAGSFGANGPETPVLTHSAFVLASVVRAFCPTGPGGGIDNSCSAYEGDASPEQYKEAAAEIDEEAPNLSKESRDQAIKMRARSEKAIADIKDLVENGNTFERTKMSDTLTQMLETDGETPTGDAMALLTDLKVAGGVAYEALDGVDSLVLIDAAAEAGLLSKSDFQMEQIEVNREEGIVDREEKTEMWSKTDRVQGLILGPPGSDGQQTLPGMDPPSRTSQVVEVLNSLEGDKALVAGALIDAEYSEGVGTVLPETMAAVLNNDIALVHDEGLGIITVEVNGKGLGEAESDETITPKAADQLKEMCRTIALPQQFGEPDPDQVRMQVVDAIKERTSSMRDHITNAREAGREKLNEYIGYQDNFEQPARELANLETALYTGLMEYSGEERDVSLLGEGTSRLIDPSSGDDEAFRMMTEERPGTTDRDRVTKFLRTLTTERFRQLADNAGVTFKNPEAYERYVEKMWGGWTSSSSSREGIEIQDAVAVEFGLPATRFYGADERVPDNDAKKVEDRYAGADGGASNRLSRARAFVRAQWEVAQYTLRRQGIEELDLYRGVILPKEVIENEERQSPTPRGMARSSSTSMTVILPKMKIERNGASSWTETPDVANDWNGVGLQYDAGRSNERVVLRAKVPRENVISAPVFGDNDQGEREFVLTSAPKRSWTVFLNRAPTFSEWDETEHPRGPDGRFIESANAERSGAWVMSRLPVAVSLKDGVAVRVVEKATKKNTYAVVFHLPDGSKREAKLTYDELCSIAQPGTDEFKEPVHVVIENEDFMRKAK